MAGTRPHVLDARLDALARRIRNEFADMPGMHLTFEQIRRLWHLSPDECALLLDRLVGEDLLTRDEHCRFHLHDSWRRSALASRRALERGA